MSVDDAADDPLTCVLEFETRYTPEAIRAVWADGGELWDQFSPQLAALGWTGLDDDGPPMPPLGPS
jgi:hypothetical protein